MPGVAWQGRAQCHGPGSRAGQGTQMESDRSAECLALGSRRGPLEVEAWLLARVEMDLAHGFRELLLGPGASVSLSAKQQDRVISLGGREGSGGLAAHFTN